LEVEIFVGANHVGGRILPHGFRRGLFDSTG